MLPQAALSALAAVLILWMAGPAVAQTPAIQTPPPQMPVFQRLEAAARLPTRETYLQQSRQGMQALQTWYVPATGLYDTAGWWNAANALTVLINQSRAAKSQEYLPVIANTYAAAPKLHAGFLNDYYDDEGWWALAWIDAYDLTQKPEYLATAASIFADMTGAWDGTCGGGIWWSRDKNYKNAIANELFLSVAAQLANRTPGEPRHGEYLGWAQKEWAWFAQSGMINAQNLVNDGLDLKTCKNNGKTAWSYNQGVVLGGLAALHQSTHDAELLSAAAKIANAAMTNLSDTNGVLHDTCEPNCGGDGVQFKGIFLRNLMALQQEAPDPHYKGFAQANAASIWHNSRALHDQFGQVWSGPFTTGDAGSQSSALDAFVAAAAMQ